jgi:hypothetical protein
MHYVHKVTVTIHTASQDDFLKNQGIDSYFENVCINLARQTFRSFELVYIDTFYEENKNKFDSIFPKHAIYVKHVPLHPNHRYWHDVSGTYISAAKNTGMLYADGELVISFDDAEFLPDDLISRYWGHYQQGYNMLALHKRLKSIDVVDGKIIYPIKGDEYVNDHRFGLIKNDVMYHTNGSNAFAGTSYALLDGLKLNGFNERMDGCKSLEDCDFGYRLSALGRKFAFDKRGFVHILDHQSYTDRNVNVGWSEAQEIQASEMSSAAKSNKKVESIVCVENYGVHMLAVQHNQLKANSYDLTQEHYDTIRRETLKYRNFDPYAEENKEKFELWNKVPNFDLMAEREEIRKNNWRW